MGKFHINGKGIATQCRAGKRSCPFGDESQHFESKEQAEKYADTKNELELNDSLADLNTNNMTAKEISSYIELVDNYIKAKEIEIEQKSSENRKNRNLLKAELENKYYKEHISTDLADIVKQANQKTKEQHWIKHASSLDIDSKLDYFTKNLEGPSKVVRDYVLKYRYKNGVGGYRLYSDELDKKHLEWISQYKTNKEMLEKDYNELVNKMNEIESYEIAVKKYNQIVDNINYQTHQEVNEKYPLYSEEKHKQGLQTINRKLNNLKKSYEVHSDLEKYTNQLINSYTKLNIKDTMTIDVKNLKYNDNGQIDNLYIANNSNQVSKVNKIENGKLVTNNGTISLDRRLYRDTRGLVEEMPDVSLIVTNTNSTTQYTGDNKLESFLIDSTD